MALERLTRNFWLLDGKLLYFHTDDLPKEPEEYESRIKYCGDPVFICQIEDDGDPWIETTATAVADEKLFKLFIAEVKAKRIYDNLFNDETQ